MLDDDDDKDDDEDDDDEGAVIPLLLLLLPSTTTSCEPDWISIAADKRGLSGAWLSVGNVLLNPLSLGLIDAVADAGLAIDRLFVSCDFFGSSLHYRVHTRISNTNNDTIVMCKVRGVLKNLN